VRRRPGFPLIARPPQKPDRPKPRTGDPGAGHEGENMPEIKVTFSALETAQGDVTTTADRIAAQLSELQRYLAPLVAAWEGRAATEYQARQRQWDTAAADLAAVLKQIGVALGAANESYRQVEKSNADRWR
jgi:6 kDa early secretory antigenic target